jgi:hypothetical protein
VEDEGSALVVDINRVAWDQDRYAAFSGDGVVVLGMDTGNEISTDNGGQMTFGKIYLANMDMNTDGNIDIEADFDGQFHMNFGYDLDNDFLIPNTGSFTLEAPFGTPGFVPHTTIYGFDMSNSSSIRFNGLAADDLGSQFIDLNSALGNPETIVNDLWDSIRTALKDTAVDNYDAAGPGGDLIGPEEDDNVFVYRTFDELLGNADINGDGYFSSDLGVLAYDQEIEGEYGFENTGSLTALVFLNDLNGTITAESISGYNGSLIL